jgi:ribosomal protein S18 acetylase RimI-like enzyme
MELVREISSIANAYNYAKSFKKRFITNCFITTEQFKKTILNESLYEITIGEVCFLLKKNKYFYNLYYYASSINELTTSLPDLLKLFSQDTLVVDLLVKNEKSTEISLYEQNGFNLYTSLIRMSNTGKMIYNKDSNSMNVRNAIFHDIAIIEELFNLYFDPIAEQLPDTDDLLNWVKNNAIIVYEVENKILGFIIYDLKASTLFLRYWFVKPNYRDLRIGSKLFNEFLSRGKDTQRQMFWVIRSNENAINRYIHYGFKEELMYNFVYINKPLKYEN